jgi:hypothetical protein
MTNEELKEIEQSDEWYGESLHKGTIFSSEEWESKRYFEWKERVKLRNSVEYKEWEKEKKYCTPRNED